MCLEFADEILIFFSFKAVVFSDVTSNSSHRIADKILIFFSFKAVVFTEKRN